jgi:hypothetical protein
MGMSKPMQVSMEKGNSGEVIRTSDRLDKVQYVGRSFGELFSAESMD